MKNIKKGNRTINYFQINERIEKLNLNHESAYRLQQDIIKQIKFYLINSL